MLGATSAKVVLAVAILLGGCATMSPAQKAEQRMHAMAAAGMIVPGAVETPGASHRAQMDALRRWLERQGWTVDVSADNADCDGKCYGFTRHSTKYIWIADGPSVNTQFHTLLHEAAHVLWPAKAERPVLETVAEMIAYLAAHDLGLDVAAGSFGYIQPRTSDMLRTMIYRQHGRRMEEIAAVLVRASGGPR